MNTAGIDVSHKTLMLSVSKAGKLGKAREFTNDANGHKALLKVLRAAKVERVCLEATGTYHLDLALRLDAGGVALMVLNPKAAKRFAEALLTRNKTDAVDAGVLAQYAERMPFIPWQRPRDEVLTLRAVARQIASLKKTRAGARNRLHAMRQSALMPAAVIDSLERLIEECDAQIDALRAYGCEHIAAHRTLAAPFELLLSVKGIAEASAIELLGERLVLPEDMAAKQWVAMAGLDPREVSSGSSVNKGARLSKAGNRHLRQALYMPALSAAQHDPHIRAFYQQLIAQRGLKKIQALCAVMRKLLHGIHAMFKSGQTFQSARLCPPRPGPAAAAA
jgi:transposase